MKVDSVLEVLMVLFQYHMEHGLETNELEAELLPKLEKLGFTNHIILRAFYWLASLEIQSQAELSPPTSSSTRVFSVYECQYIDLECREFILMLERIGILNSHTREMVIHQILELTEEGIDISLIKWVTLMVLFKQRDQQEALTAMEYLVLDESIGGFA